MECQKDRTVTQMEWLWAVWLTAVNVGARIRSTEGKSAAGTDWSSDMKHFKDFVSVVLTGVIC